MCCLNCCRCRCHWDTRDHRTDPDNDTPSNLSPDRVQIPTGRTCDTPRRHNEMAPCTERHFELHFVYPATLRHTHQCTSNPRQLFRLCTECFRIRRPCDNVESSQLLPKHSVARPWLVATPHVSDAGRLLSYLKIGNP